MIVSELIVLLSQHLADHGDKEVVIIPATNTRPEMYEVDSVRVVEFKGERAFLLED